MTGKPTILHTEASNGWGGQEIRIFSEMIGMKARGHDVLLATPPDTTIYRKAKDAGIKTLAVPMDKNAFIGGVRGLYKVVKENNVDIIGTHSSRDSWIGSIAGRLAGAKVIRYRHISSKLSTSFFTKLVYGPLCDAIITTGGSIKANITEELGISPAKVRSIPTGTDIGRFAGVSGSAVRSELDIGPDDLVLGTAAVLRSWKGHKFIVHAMPRILAEVPQARLVLAGEGPMLPYLEGWCRELGIEDNVHMIGYREDVDRVIAAFDVCVLASYASEGIPQFVLQSMASGKPVIGTTVGGIPEVVTDGVTGLLVPPEDADAIAGAAIRLFSDADMRRRMGEAGRAVVSERHTLDVMLDSVERLYGEVLSK